MGPLLIAPDAEAAAQSAAERIDAAIAERRRSNPTIHLALAGGRTPRRTYELLAAMRADWSGVHLWLGDERMVSLDSPEANARMVREALAVPAGIPPEQVHVVQTQLGARRACSAYAGELRREIGDDDHGFPTLDLAVLGLGEDAHTASLFPGSPALGVDDAICVVVEDAPKPPPTRISMTLPLLNAARARVVLATGDDKAAAVAAAMGHPDVRAPASLLARDGTTWILDEAAAPLIAPGRSAPASAPGPSRPDAPGS
jgi:6-phosphogluconolactonase